MPEKQLHFLPPLEAPPQGGEIGCSGHLPPARAVLRVRRIGCKPKSSDTAKTGHR